MTGQPETSAASREGEALGAADATCSATRHGTSTAYREGCRCRAARDEVACAQRRRMKRRYLNRGPLEVAATGTHRRLQALQANGWPRRELAARLGYNSGCLPPFLHAVVHIDTAARVRALYDALADIPGPSNSSRVRARAKGWLPPIWWDDDFIDDEFYKEPAVWHNSQGQAVVDDVAIDRYLAGDSTVLLHRDEKRAAFTRLLTAGWAPNTAGKFLGINGVYVRRYVLEAGPAVGGCRDDAHMNINQGDAA